MKAFSKKVKWTLLCSGILLLIGLAVYFIYIIYGNQEHVKAFSSAKEAYEMGHYEEAKKRLFQCVQRDSADEAAWVLIAKIYEKEEQWGRAAEYWDIAVLLNALNKEYFSHEIKALYQSHNFRKIYDLLITKPLDVQQKFSSSFLLAFVKNEKENDVVEKLIPKFSVNSETLELVQLYLKYRIKDIKSKIDSGDIEEIVQLSKSTDVVIATEALLFHVEISLQKKDLKTAEDLLKQAQQRDEKYCSYLLGDFYYGNERYVEAAKVYKKVFQDYISKRSVLFYAESLFFTNNIAELKAIEKFYQKGELKDLYNGGYIRAMIAYLSKDGESLVRNLEVVGDNINTPIYTMLKFAGGIEGRHLNWIVDAVSRIKKEPDYKEKEQTIYKKLQPLLLSFYRSGNSSAVVSIAALFQTMDPPQRLVWRIILLDEFKQKNISPEFLDYAVKSFPGDPVFSRIAISVNQLEKDYQQVLSYTNTLIKNGDQSFMLYLDKAFALQVLGKSQEAKEIYLQLLKKNPENMQIAKQSFLFALYSGDKEILQIIDKIPALKELSDLALQRMGDSLENYKTMLSQDLYENKMDVKVAEDRALLFILAVDLAKLDLHERAIAIYERLKPYADDPTLIELNLSELYADIKKQDKALENAHSAWQRNNFSKVIKNCYGLRLADSKKWDEAIRMLDVKAKDPRVKPALIQSYENLVKSTFEQHRDYECKNYIKAFRVLALESPIIHSYSVKLEKAEETKLEKVAETKPEKVAETKPEEVAETKPEEVAETKPEKIEETKPEKVEETKPEKVEETKPEKVEETKLEKAEETKLEKVEETKPEKVEETKPEKVEETKPEKVEETKPEKAVETKPEEAEETNPEKVEETKPEAAEETKSEKVTETKSEKVTETKSEEVEETKSEKVTETKSEKVTETKSEEVEETKLEKVGR